MVLVCRVVVAVGGWRIAVGSGKGLSTALENSGGRWRPRVAGGRSFQCL